MFAWFFGAKAGVAHVRNDRMMQQGAGSAGFPFPAVAGWVTGAWLIAASLSLALGIWIDLGALMIAVFLTLAGMYFHRFWPIEDPTQRRTQEQLFYRNFIGVGACLIMFGTFATLGPELRYVITAPLFNF